MSDSSPKSVAPLVLEPGPSRRVRLVTLAAFSLAIIAFAVLPLPMLLFVPGFVLLIVAFSYTWHRHHALSGHPITVRLDSEGSWHWQQGDASESVELLPDSYHMSFLTILNFRPAGKQRPLRTLLLTTDNIDADTFRRLRVHLNWQPPL